ncbi:MAG TPA: sensor histidine kinase [Acidimicrobiia bacterium]|nr:sensor histidine kinase [Acidimicrobiia bacterium]
MDRSATRRWSTDALAAVVVAGALCLRVATPWEAEARPPDWRAYGLMVLMGALLLVRRRYPLGVLYASLAVLCIYYLHGFGAVGATWPIAPALFNAALLGQWKAASWVAGGVIAGSSYWRFVYEPESDVLATFSDLITEIFVAVTVILAGAMILNHRLLEREIRERERAVAAERDAEARTRLTEQRLYIAREIHDIVAHSLAGIGVQARVAEEVLDTDTNEARRSIRAIIDATSDAIGQLRETVGSLRSLPASPPDLETLVSGIRGLDVDLEVEGEPADPETEMVVASIVRESLTNVIRHSGASKAKVSVVHGPDEVSVEVTDDGQGSGDFVEGHGIRGMRERAEALGGKLEAGAADGGGFRVAARIPR